VKRATGIGGVFFRAEDPQRTMEWYRRHLGLNIDESYGTSFESSGGFTAWSPFAAGTDYFGAADQQFMINYRVADLEGLLEQLVDEGVEIAVPLKAYEYGKFAHVVDCDGRRVELWEPDDEAYGEMVAGKTTS